MLRIPVTFWGVSWPVYFVVSMCSWAAVAAALNAGGGRLAAERANGWTRQLRLTPLPSWAYALGKTLISVGLALAAAVTLALVAASAARPHLSVATWAALIGACWLGSLPFAAVGILLGLAANSSSAQPVLVAAMLVLNVFGGLLIPDVLVLVSYAVAIAALAAWRFRADQMRPLG